jgi:hypothetical protein
MLVKQEERSIQGIKNTFMQSCILKSMSDNGCSAIPSKMNVTWRWSSKVETCSKCIYFNDMWNILTSILVNKMWTVSEELLHYRRKGTTNKDYFSEVCVFCKNACIQQISFYVFLYIHAVIRHATLFVWKRYYTYLLSASISCTLSFMQHDYYQQTSYHCVMSYAGGFPIVLHHPLNRGI